MLSKCYLPVFILVAVLLSGCFDDDTAEKKQIQGQLNKVDSFYFAGQGPQGLALLKSIRPEIKSSSEFFPVYYYYMAQHFIVDGDEMNLYADSALTFFKKKENITKYPDQYFNTLTAKSNACLKTGKYVTSLDYLYQAKSILPKTTYCDNGYLASQMGVIYYGQKNFKNAARYWLESYNKLGACNKKTTPRELFYKQQGALDNAAVSYEQAGMLDSANYYYLKDLDLVNKAVKSKLVVEQSISAALEVIYDNLGGLRLKQGNLSEAKYYLTKCLSLPDAEVDGARIPPLIKLAELDIQLGNYKEAYQAFSHSKALLSKYMAANPDSYIRWQRVYALYLSKTGKQDSSYIYLNRYITSKETSDKSGSELYRLNVEREMDGMQRQQSLNELSQRDKVKKLYLEGIGVIAILSLIIVYLVNRNLKKARKNHLGATLQNHQLQQTLNELELVNKNYIRIMRVMAHDLRNPLAGMIGLATILISEDEYNHETRHMLQLIESTGEHSIEMINELLKTGLADENELMSTREIDIQALLYDSIELLRFKAKEKKQQIFFDGTDEPVIVRINHEKIWRVFNNLIVNAIKFSHEGTYIKVGLQVLDKKKCVLISIADSGIGIPPEQKESVFEMFTSAKKMGTSGEQPFGLGLSISKRLVENHGGKIWFDSTVGVGSTFYIELPL